MPIKAGGDQSKPARRVLYERARAALLAQLRGVTPALNESDITRERLALEDALPRDDQRTLRLSDHLDRLLHVHR